MLDLSTLLQQTPTPPAPTQQLEPTDKLADQEILLSLRLAPANQFGQRLVSGTIGLRGQMPRFLPDGILLSDVLAALQPLYAGLSLTEPDAPVPVETAAKTIATAPVSESALLDIF